MKPSAALLCLLSRGILALALGCMPAAAMASAPNPLVIMPLGDSVTAGGGTAVNGGPPPGSFRAPLYSSLTGEGYNVQYVGDQTSNPGGGLPSNQITAYACSIITHGTDSLYP